MGIFSIVLILFNIYNVLNKKDIKIKYLNVVSLLIIIEILFLNANFIGIDDNNVSCKFIMDVIVGIYSIYILLKLKLKINKWLCIYMMGFIFSVTMGILLEIAFPYDNLIINYDIPRGWDLYVLDLINKEKVSLSYGTIFLLYVKIFIYTIVTCIIKTLYKKQEIIYIINNVLKYSRFIICYGFFEFILKNIFDKPEITQSLLKIIFNAYNSQLSLNDDTYRLIGISSEPSYFVMSLFMLIVLNILVDKFYNKNGKYISYYKYDKYFMIVLMCLSGGFSAIWYLIMILLIIIMLRNRKKSLSMKEAFKYILILLLFIVVILLLVILLINIDYGYISERIKLSINIIQYLIVGGALQIESATYLGSNLARLTSIYDVTIDFLNRPFFGLGIGVEVSHGGFSMLLADFGIVGVYFLMKMALYRVNKFIKYDYLFLFIFFVIVNIPIGVKGIGYEIYNILFIEITQFYRKG